MRAVFGWPPPFAYGDLRILQPDIFELDAGRFEMGRRRLICDWFGPHDGLYDRRESVEARIGIRAASGGEVCILHVAETQGRRDQIEPHRREHTPAQTMRGLLHHPLAALVIDGIVRPNGDDAPRLAALGPPGDTLHPCHMALHCEKSARMILGVLVGETQVFEFKGNALMHFRVYLRSGSLSVSTMRKAGGEAVKTWDVDFSRIESVRVAERRGARTSLSGLYLKPRGSDVVMFAWQKSALGAPVGEGRTYYTAAVAALRAIAAKRPDLSATIGPGRSSLVGATLGAIVFVAAAFSAIGQVNSTFAITAGGIIALYGFSALRSGALQKTREVSLTHAADELAARTAH